MRVWPELGFPHVEGENAAHAAAFSGTAVPLDPDMRQETYAPDAETLVWEHQFEPGRYRVSATGPGEARFSTEVSIFPGQENSFTLPIAASAVE